MNHKAWIATVAALLTTQAYAEEVRFQFTASIDWMAEYDGDTRVSTFVNASDFAGSTVTKSAEVRGTFYFDTSSPLNSSYQPPMPATGAYVVYSLPTGTWGMSYTVGSLSFVSGGTLPGHVQVANNASTLNGWDLFYLQASNAYDATTMYQGGTLSWFDSTATALSSSALPSAPEIVAFPNKKLTASWLRRADGDQMNIGTTITSFQAISPVPEPSSAAMLIAGGLGLAFVRTRRRLAEADH